MLTWTCASCTRAGNTHTHTLALVATSRVHVCDGVWYVCARSRARAQCTIYYEYAFPDSDAQQAEFDAVRLACLLNSSACALRLRRPTEALEHASKAVYAEPRSAKALFRRAQAGRALDDLDAAARDAAAALALAPEDPALRREAALIAGKRRAYWGREAAMNRRMLGGGGGGGGGSGAVEVGDGAGDGSDSGSEGEGAAAGDVPIEVRCAVCVCMLCVVCEFVCSRARTHNVLGAPLTSVAPPARAHHRTLTAAARTPRL
jgi:hypothetical protein